ncbi:hypothetical protein [Micrococcus luteus]|uniref:hypothetical protein n=1 Tax=Micrococcus luteus TaxID=1270 RepID=UPI0021523BA9|nr:hypothetical protein [Micrococcus luteus]MCV7528086.1 hypothetical protein [Micrococcus luteus]
MPPASSAPSAECGRSRPRPADVAARPDAPSPRATALLFALAVAAGSVMPLQGRINSRLAHLTGAPSSPRCAPSRRAWSSWCS